LPGKSLIEKLFKGHIHLCPECSNKLLTRVVYISRLVPVVSFDIISYGAGLTNMSFIPFIAATFIGMIPLTFIYTYFGSIIDLKNWISIIIGIIFVALFFLLPVLIEKYNIFSLKKYLSHKNE